ncbi:MAG: energy-coupled thiamine transporter ThiT [Bacilli bacterium]
MSKKIQWMAEIAILSALSLTLDYVSALIGGALWPQGGSISIAMVPIMIVSYRWGIKSGVTCGLIVGTIQLFWGEAAGLLAIILDYVFAYGVVGLAGIFNSQMKRANKQLPMIYFIGGILLTFLLRFSSHVASGVLVYEVPFWGSVTYNIGYLGISFVLSGILVMLMYLKTPQLVFRDSVN